MASIDEYMKFINSGTEAEREFRTIELYHPDFSSTLRLVRDYVNQDFTLEATAPRDPSTSVTFTASGIQILEPAESGEIEQILSVTLAGVNNLVNDQVALITPTNSLTPVELIYRKYYSGDLTTPVLILNLSVSDIGFKSYEKVTFTAEDTNFAIKRAGELYTLERFPGLKRT